MFKATFKYTKLLLAVESFLHIYDFSIVHTQTLHSLVRMEKEWYL